MTEELLYFNGVNGATGEYDVGPMTAADLAAIATGLPLGDKQHLLELEYRKRMATKAHYGVRAGIDAKDLAQTGWGVIFASDADPAVREALSELLEWRKAQAGDYYREYVRGQGYRPDESKPDFLKRHGAGPGPVTPPNLPYYLLLVGDPERMPYRFQYQLDVQYAVGRLHFETLDDYARYAGSVVEAEKQKLALPRQAAFFGVSNPGDPATRLSAEQLVRPLAEGLTQRQSDWSVNKVLGEAATKTRLAKLLGGAETPALLFSASHGLGFPPGDNKQLPQQGALLCQDWPGPQAWKGAIKPDFYFSADDVGAEARLLGLLAFFFACYGAGTPRHDDFAAQAFKDTRAEIAPQAFVARLPQRLLAHPRGGALAVVGHVDRAWGYSFMWDNARHLTVFEDLLRLLIDGYPLGAAIESFNERYAELSSDLNAELEEIKFGKKPDAYELSDMWTANNDARNYMILGDPAVRLMAGAATAAERPAIAELATLPLKEN